jgi:hypothetical protein
MRISSLVALRGEMFFKAREAGDDFDRFNRLGDVADERA